MGMKKSAQVAVAALVLMLGGTLAFRFIPATVPAHPSSPAPPSLPSPVPAVPLAEAPAGSVALRWVALLGSLHAKPPSNGAEEEMARSQEREFAEELKKRLAQDPSRWPDVLEVLSEEDPRIGRKIVGSLADGVDDAAEGGLIQALKSGRHREARISSASLIGRRHSTGSFWALVTAAQEDSDSGVRYKALSELAMRQGRAGSPEQTTTIDQLLRLRAQVDPDAEVRQFALRVTGQVSDARPAPPPERRAGLRPN
jgi:hypothetical protein